jgi:NTE family protein
MSSLERPTIGLALSGGGIRAMVFHMGMLRYLAERSLLEHVGRISTVSGGSLLVGLMLQKNGLHWPTSQVFLSAIYPALRQQLCARSLQWGAARQLLNPANLRFLLSRANLLALALKMEWGVVARLSDVPSAPEWSINGTTAETGKRFRFKRDDMGDYTLGYAAVKNFPLADALAVSAAFPGGFGPLRVRAKSFDWRKRPWGASAGTEVPTDVEFGTLHLYDGGVYDNLGLEPFFDAGRLVSKYPGLFIVVSDAGAPLARGFSLGSLNPFRLKRVADIMADQAHALRLRTFSTYLQQRPGRGALIHIGTPPSHVQGPSAQFAATFPTTLRRITARDFDAISDYGRQLSVGLENGYGQTRCAATG